jgi:quinol-cytochrome oxidoreductase complex cytochrome b subunit
MLMTLTLTVSVAQFSGYALVWGQMEFWFMTQFTNFLRSLDVIAPGLGSMLVGWLWGA